MASITSITKTHFHARSNSLPSKSSQNIELDDLEATTSSSTISQQMDGLRDLFSSFDKILARDIQKEGVNDMLDELLGLLELCSTAKDSLQITKESAQELQSVLRTKRGDSIRLSKATQEYQSKRKAVKKTIVKALRNSKGLSIKKIQETPLKEMELVTSSVLESLLCFILGSSSVRKSNKWSLVSKMLGPMQSSEENLVGKVDLKLGQKFTCLKVENMQTELAQMESSLEDLQERLECISRHLIKTRVFLLNLLNN